MDAYDYGLPPAAIAQEPVEPRSAARLLVGPGVVDGPGPARATMGDLPGLLRPGDVLVVNDTRVLPGPPGPGQAVRRPGRGPPDRAVRRR